MNDFLVVINTGLTMGLIFLPSVLAMMLCLRIVDFPDLSIEGSFPLGAAVTGLLLKNNYPIAMSLILALLAGAFTGAVTGIIHEKLKVSKLLSGIIVLTMLHSVNLRILGGSNIGLLGQNTLFTFFSKIKATDRS